MNDGEQSSAVDPMLDIRVLAQSLKIQPIELVRELQADGVPLLQLSAKRWRMAETDYQRWFDARTAKAAEQAEQTRLRMRHVAGKSEPKSTKRRAEFRK